jgi:HAMP domain-containing protein
MKMRNSSIRTKILGAVLAVNLLGAAAIMVYLHGSFSKSLDRSAATALTSGQAAWGQLSGDTPVDPVASPDKVAATLKKMTAITGGQYAFLLDKGATTPAAYAKARQKLGLPDNWSEGDTVVLLVSTDQALADKISFQVAAGDVPESGRLVGVENGACSRTCHAGVAGSGNYWTVRWSSDSKTRAHAVFPVVGASNQPVGVVYAIEDLTPQADGARTSMLQTLMVVVITFLASAIVIALVVDAIVLRRLAHITQSMEDIGQRVAGGDFGAHFVPDGTQDEIGRFEEFFSKLVNLVSATLQQLSERADEGKGPADPGKG